MRKVYLIAVIFFSVVISSHAEERSGEKVYQGSCIACHGEDGKGTFSSIPDLTQETDWLTKSNDKLIESILRGSTSSKTNFSMPPRGGDPTLTEQEAENALQYMQRTFGHQKKK